MELYTPVMTAATKAGKQTEGSTITEATPTAELEGAKLETVAPMLIITQQLHDRGFTGGGAFDEVIGRQIHQQLDQEVDLYVLNQAITNGESVTGETSYSNKGLYRDMALAREKLTDTGGTRLTGPRSSVHLVWPLCNGPCLRESQAARLST
jgi:hypothetical protein